MLGAMIALGGLTVAGQGPVFRNATGIEIPWENATRNLSTPPPRGSAVPPAPLYPHVLKGLGLNSDPARARSTQLILLGFLLPFFAALAGLRWKGTGAAWSAGCLVLLTGSFHVHAAWFVPAAWQAACVLALLALVAGRKTGPVTAVGAGVLLGISGLCGSLWAVPAALGLAAAFLVDRRPALSGLLAAGFLVFLAGPTLAPGGGGPGLPATTTGIDAALGFHSGASGLDSRRIDAPGWRWLSPADILTRMTRESGEPPDPQRVNAVFGASALRFVAANPVEALGLVGWKLLLMLQAYDPPSPESVLFRASATVPWAKWLLPVAALVLGFGVAGLIFGKDGRRPLLILGASVLLVSAFGVVRSGDRLALLAVLALPAGAALAVRDRRTVAAGVALTALLGASWFVLPARYESRADEHYAMGVAFDRLKRPAESMAELDRAVRLDPHHVSARVTLAAGLARDGLHEQAAEEIQRALEDAPDLVQGWRFLARMQQDAGRLEDAARSWMEVGRLDPRNAEARNNLGTVYAALGKYDEAVDALEEALVLDPTYREAGINLTEIRRRGPEGLTGARLETQGPGNAVLQIQSGVAEAMQKLQAGDAEGAAVRIQELRATYGATPDIDFASGNLAMNRGEFEQAIELYERSRTQISNNPVLLLNLGAAYAQTGNLERAVPLWEEVLRIDPSSAVARQNLEAARASGAAPSTTP